MKNDRGSCVILDGMFGVAWNRKSSSEDREDNYNMLLIRRSGATSG